MSNTTLAPTRSRANVTTTFTSGNSFNSTMNSSSFTTTAPYYSTTFDLSFLGSGSGNSDGDTSSSDDTDLYNLYCQLGVSTLMSVINGDFSDPDDDSGDDSSGSTTTKAPHVKNSKFANATKEEFIEKKCALGAFTFSNDSLPSIGLLTIAAAVILALIWTQRRVNLCRSFLGGRPSLLTPFPVIEPGRNRLSFVAFWAMVAYEGIQIIVNSKSQFIDMTCVGKWEKPIILLVNVHIFAVLYFPVIAAISTDTTLGYMISTCWIWALSVVRAYNVFTKLVDDNSTVLTHTVETVLQVFSYLIPFISMLYLCVALPLRLARGLLFVYRGKIVSMYRPINELPHFQVTAEGLYVAALFRKPKPPIAHKGIKKILHMVVSKIYVNVPYFRYSQNILSALTIGGVFIYYEIFVNIQVLVELGTFWVPQLLQLVQSGVPIFISLPQVQRAILKATKGNSTAILHEKAQWVIRVGGGYVWTLFYAELTALLVVILIQGYLLVNMLQTYRDDRMKAQRGIYDTVDPPSSFSGRGVIGGASRYVGFQAVMFAWGFIFQVVVFTLAAIVIGYVFFLPLIHGFGEWIILLILSLLPAIAVTVGLAIIQQLLVAFCFTQVPCGKAIAVNNPRGYSNYVYLSFFKSLFVGLISALLRLILSVVLGAIVFSRLDMPTITPRFRRFDTGYKAYQALIHLENAHMNPTLVSFCNLVLDRIREQKQERRALMQSLIREAVREKQGKRRSDRFVFDGQSPSHSVDEASNVKLEITSSEDEFRQVDTIYAERLETDRQRKCIRFKWHVLRTLVFNPKLAIDRKMALKLDMYAVRDHEPVTEISTVAV